MDDKGDEVEYLTSRVEQLQHERDELRKDIEQLCLQQAGPSYIAAATRMHFQRTAGLEQEIESLKQKLAGCTREKHNLQEELSEAYQIKSQLADLHSAEVLKNKEAEKQLKFFQTCVAAAFSERDHALMEAEKAKEREEAASERLATFENRLGELQSAYHDEKKLNSNLETELSELKEQNEYFEKVVNKFYEIVERETGSSGDHTWHGKCLRLLEDPSDSWIFNDDSKGSTSKYIASLEEELEKRKISIDNLQSNLRMGLQIERHLKRNIQFLEKKQSILAKNIESGLSALRDFHNQQRSAVVRILEEEASQIKSVIIEVQEILNQVHINSKLKCEAPADPECRDVHMTNVAVSDVHTEKSGFDRASIVKDRTCEESDTLAQALQEKVSALLLLSQQEERHLLERDLNQALQNKMEELQRNLSQVTNEKVQVLIELARIKQENQQLQESISRLSLHKTTDDGYRKSITIHEEEGKLKNLLKRSYLKRWVGKGLNEQEIVQGNTDGTSHTDKKDIYQADLARLKVENASLQESVASLEHLSSSIRRLHTILLKAQDDAASTGPLENISEALNKVIVEANHMKTALGGSLPVSWSADATVDAATYQSLYEPTDPSEATKDRVDPVSSAGLEMVELLILATQLLQNSLVRKSQLEESAVGVC